jgi:hypothetical protein
MARRLRLRHRELHAREEAALAALADVALGRLVGLCTGDSELVEAEVGGNLPDVGRRHARIVPR